MSSYETFSLAIRVNIRVDRKKGEAGIDLVALRKIPTTMTKAWRRGGTNKYLSLRDVGLGIRAGWKQKQK